MTMNKKYFIAVLLLMIAGLQTAWAQSVLIKLSDNRTVVYNVNKVENISFTENNCADNYEYVDLGLPSGTLWASCNIGAESPEDYGDYFAWGETEAKTSFGWSNYSFGTSGNISKYTSNDGIEELLSGDDAAVANWGNEWKMPSKEQFEELINSNYTTTVWTTQNGVTGRLITSKSNGKSIFMPAAGGYGSDGQYGIGSDGYYWTGTVNMQRADYSFALHFKSNSIKCESFARYAGRPIRPVRSVAHEFIDLGLPSGTLWATSNIGAESPEDVGDYFAWGETEPKDVPTEYYNFTNYLYCKGTGLTLTKYCSQSSYGYNGFTDELTELLPGDDAATINWGSDCQMPSKEQFQELIQYSTITLTTQNGVSGRKVTSNINGKSIFFPFTGYFFENGISDKDKQAYYWSRSLYTSEPAYSQALTFYTNINNISCSRQIRAFGCCVRPVRKQ
jgi:hypothetical protein